MLESQGTAYKIINQIQNIEKFKIAYYCPLSTKAESSFPIESQRDYIIIRKNKQ